MSGLEWESHAPHSGRWETEQDRLSPSKISKIAKALGIKPEQLWRPPASRPSDLDYLAEDMSKEVDLLELMRIDRSVQNKRRAAQTVIDVEADREHIPAVRNRARIPATAGQRRISSTTPTSNAAIFPM